MNKTRHRFSLALTFDGWDITRHYYDEDIVTIEEFLLLQYKGYVRAMQRQHKLFHKYTNEDTGMETRIGLN